MDQNLQTVIDFISKNIQLSESEKASLISNLKETDKKITITEFKLDRTEKVKRTTAILLEETIEELEQKRKAVEAQNKELEIQTALEKVRSIALSMKEPADMLVVCRIISEQLQSLNVKNIRNVQTVILYESKSNYLNYEYFKVYDKTSISEIDYNLHPKVLALVNEIKKASDTYFTNSFEGKELKEWRQYREQTEQVPDPHSYEVTSVHFYFYSIGPGGLGVSTYNTKLNEEELIILKRFRNVFELAYRKFLDIEKAIAQAREAKIEAALEKVRSRSLAMHKSNELQEVIETVFDQILKLGILADVANFIIFNQEDKDINCWIASPTQKIHRSWHMPYMDIYPMNAVNTAKENGKDSFSASYSFEQKNKFFNWAFEHSDFKYFPDDRKQFILESKSLATSYAWVKHTGIQLSSYTRESFTENETEILKRFARVFEQSYIRFLDLQKAEAQAKEAQIELALERVRARTMAMQRSDELSDAAQLLYHEFGTLGLKPFTCGYLFIKEEQNKQTAWVTLPDGTLIPDFIDFPLTGDDVMNKRYEAWKQKKPLHVLEVQGEANREHHRYLATKVPDHIANEIFAQIPDRVIFYCANFSAGYLFIIATEFFTPDEEQTIIRFAKVFEQTYTRFLDLQKAEAQAKEAKIELALERVRARTMAMQRSEELSDAAVLLFQQVKSFGLESWGCGFNIWEKDEKVCTSYFTNPEGNLVEPYQIPLTEDPIFIRFYESRQNGEDFWIQEISGQEEVDHYKYLCSLPVVGELLKKLPEAGIPFPTFQIDHGVNFSHGNLLFITYEPVPEAHEIFKRFGKVFEQTYTRFLDLQKAEAQAREAQIEAALERVRSCSMAMHISNDLQEVVKVLSDQLLALGLKFDTANFAKVHKDGSWDLWISTSDQPYPAQIYVPYFNHRIFTAVNEADERHETFFTSNYTLEEKNSFFKYFFEKTAAKDIPDERKQYVLNRKGFFRSVFLLKNIWLSIVNYEGIPFTDYENAMLQRFANVFEQAYTRFLDLQKAEAQARESKIELGLERVRARAMAMQTSEELKDLIGTVFTELTKLDLIMIGSVIIIFDPQTNSSRWWMVNSNAPSEPLSFFIKYHENTPYQEFIKAWKERKVRWEYELQGSTKKEWDEFLFTQTELASVPAPVIEGMKTPQRILLSTSFNNFGCLNVGTLNPLTEEQFDILLRFAKVFDLTYTRFNDLQKAEAQAREAQIELGLERVRAKAMAMQSSSELAELVDTVFRELTKLDLLLDRCIIMLYDAATNDSTWWIAAPETDALPISVFVKYHEYAPYLAYIDAWQKRIVKWTYVLEGVTKKEWDNFVFSETEMTLLPTAVKEGMKSIEKIFLNVSFNNFGSLTASSFETLPEEQFEILLRFAKVFDSTYTRFNDLQKAEALAKEANEHLIQIEEEKLRAETALQELQATQKQLIQSEKMASLGELTAGIAHEIQNPLNFVNNFSEVNKELLLEMKDEIDKGNINEAKLLANDLIDNQEKINQHGKRADAIVKGMLQHSRSSSGVKEPTDINALCDEYLRLSYHGLRAKDKSFNATIKTDFDETIGKINIIPQDIGRVILNLLTNAFYAVNEKKKQQPNGYEPTVSIQTKKINNKVEIKVTDNGNGIPQKVLDKIFQPFFTTKPTGEGTGLGLSLSYDIIKSHGGEIKIETKVDEGRPDNFGKGKGKETTFIIQLPVV